MESNANENGPLEARYLAFLATITNIRPQLHRYCARMTGFAMDGEDVVQDALFEAYRKLDQFDDSRPLSPWLFRIAHNRCIDFLRRQRARNAAETSITTPLLVQPSIPTSIGIRPAIEHLVVALPPKERACVLLKDVFDYSLEEIAELVDSTTGGVKAALKRGRTKLAAAPRPQPFQRPSNPRLTFVLQLYVERFNRRDWDGVRELIRADARLRVADAFAGRLADSPYFGNYERSRIPWTMQVGDVDGEAAIIVLRRSADAWNPSSIVRVRIEGDRVSSVVDYSHCPWVIQNAAFFGSASTTVTVRVS
jgi:RNA polymerase sigma-70 factor (ECF subfamily)